LIPGLKNQNQTEPVGIFKILINLISFFSRFGFFKLFFFYFLNLIRFLVFLNTPNKYQEKKEKVATPQFQLRHKKDEANSELKKKKAQVVVNLE